MTNTGTPAPTYAWVITTDHIDTGARGTAGPFGLISEQRAALIANKGCTAFRMYDDDGELYYSGRFLGDADSEDALGPLDDFGAPNAGCTAIKMRQGDGTWAAV